MERQPLAERSVVVIGGTSGLGLAAARACVAAGARVVVVGRDGDRAREAEVALGSASLSLVGDATGPETSRAAIELAVRAFGRLDGLYHVAGGSGRARGDGPLGDVTDDGWRSTIDHNLTSVFYSNRAAVRQFLAQGGGGSVLNMGSVLARRPSPRHFATHAYAAAKAAIEGMTLAAASYYAPRGIRFNVIAPALTDTRMAGRAAADPEIRRFIATKQPLDGGRIGSAADADAAVVYFLSDESRFVTGQVLAVDGGWSLSEGQYS